MAVKDEDFLLPGLDEADGALPTPPALDVLLGSVFNAEPSEDYADLLPADDASEAGEVDLSDLVDDSLFDEAELSSISADDDLDIDEVDFSFPEVPDSPVGNDEGTVSMFEPDFDADTDLGDDDDLA